jgi:serine/threonine protein kinase
MTSMHKYSIPPGYTLLNTTPISSEQEYDIITLHCRRNDDSKEVSLRFTTNETLKDYFVANVEQDHRVLAHIQHTIGTDSFSNLFWDNLVIIEHEDVIMSVKEYTSTFILLDRYIREKRLTENEFLQVALKMVKLLGLIHKCNIVCANLTLNSFFYDPKSGHVRLLDFGSCEILSAKVNFVPFSPFAAHFEKPEQCYYIARMLICSITNIS